MTSSARSAAARRPGRDKLVGTIEADDTFVGAVAAGVAGRRSQAKARIAVAVEVNGEQIGRVRLRHVPDFSADSLVTFVEASVEPGKPAFPAASGTWARMTCA